MATTIVSRGVRNAFRNIVRTVSIVMIIGLMLGLSLVMLVANRAVDSKVQSTLQAIGTTILVFPAGFSSGSTVSTALNDTQLKQVSNITHVSSVIKTLGSQLQPEGTTNSPQVTPGGDAGAGSGKNTTSVFTTNLVSPHTINCGNELCSGAGVARKQGEVGAPKLPDKVARSVLR